MFDGRRCMGCAFRCRGLPHHELWIQDHHRFNGICHLTWENREATSKETVYMSYVDYGVKNCIWVGCRLLGHLLYQVHTVT